MLLREREQEEEEEKERKGGGRTERGQIHYRLFSLAVKKEEEENEDNEEYEAMGR